MNLIGWEGGAIFWDQSQCEIEQKQSNRELLSTLNWKQLYVHDGIWRIVLQANREKLVLPNSPMYVKWKETFSFDLTVNCISSPASWATQGHQPYTLFDSNKDTVSTLLLALPSSYEGICCRLHLLALLAGLGIRFRFSSNWPGKKTTRFGWNISLIKNQGWPPLSRIQI